MNIFLFSSYEGILQVSFDFMSYNVIICYIIIYLNEFINIQRSSATFLTRFRQKKQIGKPLYFLFKMISNKLPKIFYCIVERKCKYIIQI